MFLIHLLIFLSPALIAGNDCRDARVIPGSCTIFTISKGDAVFMGNNEDWRNPSTWYWVKPAGEGEYGVLYFGFDDFGPQGGVNEKGLAFDGNALPYMPMTPHPEKLQASEAIVNNIIMRKCATVEEAITTASSYDWGTLYSGKFAGQYHLADATGDAVIIGVGSGGELAFTRKPKGDGYLISTNFNRAFPENRYTPYPCPRYARSSEMLKKINEGGELTPASLATVLNAVHEEGRNINTEYSNIYDLKNGIVHLYYWHDFDNGVELNVGEVIRSAPSPKPIKELFPNDVVEKADEEYDAYQNAWVKYLIAGWGFLVLASEGMLFAGRLKRRIGTSRWMWIVIVVITGPFGLLFLMLTKKEEVAAGG